jgi:hypothetical protein
MTHRERQQQRLKQVPEGGLKPATLRQLVISELCDAAPYAVKVKLLRRRYDLNLEGRNGGTGERGGAGAEVRDVAGLLAHLKQEGRAEVFKVQGKSGEEWFARWLDDDWAADLACGMARHVHTA